MRSSEAQLPTIFHVQGTETFLSMHQDDIVGTLSMFDRMIFKWYLTGFFPKGAFGVYRSRQGVLLKDFGNYVQERTKKLKAHDDDLSPELRSNLSMSGRLALLSWTILIQFRVVQIQGRTSHHEFRRKHFTIPQRRGRASFSQTLPCKKSSTKQNVVILNVAISISGDLPVGLWLFHSSTGTAVFILCQGARETCPSGLLGLLNHLS